MTKPACPFGTILREPSGKRSGSSAKPNRVIQLNCGEMRLYASGKTTRTWESFNNCGTKMSLL